MPEQDPSVSLPEHGAPTPRPGNEPVKGAAAETMPSPQELIKQLELQAQEHHDAWLRAKAEADNIRKRAQADIANAHKYALENFAGELLPVRDSLEAALAADNTSVESLRQGVELTLRQLDTAFEKFAIKEIHPVAEKFDPHKHQAITTVESDKPAHTVVHVLQKGYLLHERILRPALVTVSKPPAS
jgi:molecular chaperone GrpE